MTSCISKKKHVLGTFNGALPCIVLLGGKQQTQPGRQPEDPPGLSSKRIHGETT